MVLPLMNEHRPRPPRLVLAAPSWQVVVLRSPPGMTGVDRAFVASVGSYALSSRVVDEVRARGWTAALLEAQPEALCQWHPPQFADGSCQDCGRAVCGNCRARARGADRCPACEARVVARRRSTRLRQLFMMFLLAAVGVESLRWVARENQSVDATAQVRVAFVQLLQPDAVGAPMVDRMDEIGIPAIADWYAAERARYTGSEAPFIDADVLGPWLENVRPPMLPAREPSLFEQLRVALAYPNYFHDLARANGVDPDAYGARVYVIYGRDGGDLAGDSRGSRKGRIAVSFVNVDDTLAYGQVTLAHELGHIFGADDLYDEDTYLAKFPEGYVQPWAEEPYPQRFAELMAVDIPTSPTGEREIHTLNQVRVGYRTAASFGWIPEERAAAYSARGVFAADQALVEGPPPYPTPNPVRELGGEQVDSGIAAPGPTAAILPAVAR